MIPDVNIVLAAARPDHSHHVQAKTWWLEAIASATQERPIHLLPVVVSGFLRVATHPKIFSIPSTIDAATSHVDALLSLSNVAVLDAQLRWNDFKKLCKEKSLKGIAIFESCLSGRRSPRYNPKEQLAAPSTANDCNTRIVCSFRFP